MNKILEDENIKEIKIKNRLDITSYALDKNFSTLGGYQQKDTRDKYFLIGDDVSRRLNLFFQDEIKDIDLNFLTQYFYHSQILEKKRLDSLGIIKRFKFKPIIYKEGKNKNPGVNISTDGKNKLIEIFNPFNNSSVSYFYKRKSIFSGKELKAKYFYILSSNIKTDGKYICPNCGNEEEIGNIICECSYCGTKILVNNLKEKVSSIFLTKSDLQARNGQNSLLVVLSSGALMLGILIPFFFPLGIILFIFALGQLDKTGFSTTDVNYLLHKRDKYFSEEFFIGNLESKLKMLFFCDDTNNLNCLYKIPNIDINYLINKFSNVIRADMKRCSLLKLSTNNIYDYVNLVVDFDLYFFDNKKVKKETKTFYVTLKRKCGVKTNIKNDAIIYTCQNCGDSIDFYSGICESCGNKLNLEDYDWIVYKFSENNFNFK